MQAPIYLYKYIVSFIDAHFNNNILKNLNINITTTTWVRTNSKHKYLLQTLGKEHQKEVVLIKQT